MMLKGAHVVLLVGSTEAGHTVGLALQRGHLAIIDDLHLPVVSSRAYWGSSSPRP